MTDEQLVAAFEAGTVEKADWTHRAHLRVAFVYLGRGSLEEALELLRRHLLATVGRFGVKDSLVSGFHETVTVAWLRVVRSAMNGYGPYGSSEELLEEHPYLLEKRLLRLFYTRERVISQQAKESFVDGDLAGLP